MPMILFIVLINLLLLTNLLLLLDAKKCISLLCMRLFCLATGALPCRFPTPPPLPSGRSSHLGSHSFRARSPWLAVTAAPSVRAFFPPRHPFRPRAFPGACDLGSPRSGSLQILNHRQIFTVFSCRFRKKSYICSPVLRGRWPQSAGILRYGVMVALQILALSVRVRVLLSQLFFVPNMAHLGGISRPAGPGLSRESRKGEKAAGVFEGAEPPVLMAG